MSDKIKKPTVIALGYFDSVHVGHKKVIESAKAYANKHGLSLTIFTFKGNLKEKLGYPQEKCVYLPIEREKFFMQLGADEVYFAPVSRSFLGMGKLAFLNYINRRYQIKCYFTGTDYRFGSKGKGNVEYLNRYAKNHGQDYVVIDTLNILGKKCSTTAIKEALTLGDIKRANTLLGRNYSVSGVVRRDRHVGTEIGFPTVNIAINRDKFSLKNGVYSGKIDIDGKCYKTVINYGARPTFDLGERLIEAHIVGFSGDLYGKKLTVEFTDFIREIKKFNGKEELIKQLKKDVQGVKSGKDD